MKQLLSRIDQLTEQIEMGFLTYSEGMTKIKALAYLIELKYIPGSDEQVMLNSCLYDAQTALKEVTGN